MQNDLPFLIHIGFRKTATTWLQNELFIEEDTVFTPLSTRASGRSSLAFDFIYNQDGYPLSSFEDNVSTIRRNLVKILRDKKDRNRIYVMSHERLCGAPYIGSLDAKNIAERIKKVFPNAKILITIREQVSYITSLYFQYLHTNAGGTTNINRFLAGRYKRLPLFSTVPLDYVPLVKGYVHLFGKENVLVLPYEMFKVHPTAFIQKLGKFVERKITLNEQTLKSYRNRRDDKFVAYYFRCLNFFVLNRDSKQSPQWFQNQVSHHLALGLRKILIKLTPISLNRWLTQRVQKVIFHKVNTKFTHSNKLLNEIIDVDLSAYGYF